MKLSESIYRFVLRFYPAEFRHEYGREMSLLFRENARESRVSAFLQAARDLLLHAPEEHWHMLKQDLRYALRTWRQSPMLPAAALLAMALGIGANTAIFSIVHAVLLRPLPVREPHRLVRLYETNASRDLWTFTASVPNYVSWIEQSRTLDFAAFSPQGLTWTGGEEAERLDGMAATASLLPVLGMSVAAGRWFVPEEQLEGPHRVVVVSHAFWVRRFGGQSGMVGRKLIFNGNPYTVIGVARPELRVPAAPDVWVPLIVDVKNSSRGNHYITAIGRLRSGFTIQQAQTDLAAVAAELGRQFPKSNQEWSVRAIPLLHWMVSERVRTALMVLLGAVAMVLLIACANVANLQLARAAARRKEMAIRAALGAGATRISRQLVTESLLLSLLGGAGGVMAAYGVAAVARRSLVDIVPRAEEIFVDSNVLLFALGLSLLAGLLFGLAPLWQLRGKVGFESLKEAGRTSQAAPRNRTRTVLVVGQVSLTALLLIATGLLVQSFLQLGRTSLGMNPEHVMTARIAVPRARYATGRAAAEMLSRLTDSIAATPGVVAAGYSSGIPLGPGADTSMGANAGDAAGDPKKVVDCEWRITSAGYFRALRVPLLRGRIFGSEDTAESRRVYVISREAARVFYGEQDPIGRPLRMENGRVGEVIGVVEDVRTGNISDAPSPTVYFLPAQVGTMPVFAILVRTQGNPESAAGVIRQRLRELDPNLATYGARTMERFVEDNSATARIGSWVMSLLAGVALCLGMIGIYGVISYLVALRRREYGVRLALGARPADLVRMVLRQGMGLVLPGIVLGLSASLLLDGVLEKLLFGVSARDPQTYIVVAVLLSAVAVVACYAPARRAARVDPLTSLRAE